MRRVFRKCFLLSKKKKMKRILGVAILTILVMSGIVFGIKLVQEKDSVSAHPTNTIKLDEDGTNEFEVPVDATRLEEQELIDLSPNFDDYLQNKLVVPNTTKSNVIAHGSNDAAGRQVNWTINDIRRTLFGNYIVLYGSAGNSRGGLMKISVFNSEGEEISTSVSGTLDNAALRVVTGFLDDQNNNYLVRTSGNRLFRCSVRNESSITATINLDELSATEISAARLKVHDLRLVNTNLRENNRPMITGLVYPNSPVREGIIKGRIPVGVLDNENWQSGNITADVDHFCSLENVTMSELGYSEGGNEHVYTNPELFMNDNGIIYGDFIYVNSVETKRCETVQIFSTKDVNINGDNLKKREYFFRNNYNDHLTSEDGRITILNQISTTDNIYFLSKSSTETQLIQVNLNTFQDDVIQTFPPDTRLLIAPNSDGSLSYYGSTTSLQGEFHSPYYSSVLNSPYYYVQGVMEGFSSANPAQVKSLRAMELNNWLVPTHVINTTTNAFLMGGQMTDYETFPDHSYIVASDGSVQEGKPKYPGAFIGLVTILDDYSPAISSGEQSISVNITDDAIVNPSAIAYRGWNSLDRWLITGTRNGLVTDSSAIKIYDHFDMADPLIGTSVVAREEWLQRRINRNPLNITSDIEWEKLGFDKTEVGAQLVTYFVTDSQNQTSVVSRWVNKKTNQTIEEADYCLDAQNFHIPLADIGTILPDADTFKNFAKTMAWSLTKHGSTEGDQGDGLDEDGTDASKLSGKVTVDANQLKALREAKVAKPYPVDVTYKPESGIEITNRVWVFVTTKNTLPNSETNPVSTPQDTNGVVYYGNDYSLPFRIRESETSNDVLTRGNVKVYDYFDSNHETSAELPTLADVTKDANKLAVDLASINNATTLGKVTPTITYQWDGPIDSNHKDGTIPGNETIGCLDVDLIGNVLLHVRQVILNESTEITIPTESYFTIQNIFDNGGNPTVDSNYQANLIGLSGVLADQPMFTDVGVVIDRLTDSNDQIQLSVIVPEFYQYLGFHQTTELMDNDGQSHENNSTYITGPLQLSKSELLDGDEFWITLYIQPNVDDQDHPIKPQPYSWDYKKNDLGKIKTK